MRHLVLMVLFSAVPALGQGADDCANAQPVSGTGPHPFDNSSATKDGSPDGLCLFFGLDDIENDVWFTWVAPTTGIHSLSTCLQTTVDTKIAVYEGGCAGPVVGCGEDACASLQTEVEFFGIVGQTYLFRLGTYPAAFGGTGTFTINGAQPVFNPANGHSYYVVDDPSAQTWDSAQAAAEAWSHDGLPGHLLTVTDVAERDFVVSLGGLQYHWLGGYQDLTASDYSEPAGGWRWVTGEPFSFTDWHPGEPNDSGSFGSEDYMEFYNDLWNDVADLEHPLGYVVEWEAAGPIGTNYCGPANTNSSGTGADISAFGVDMAGGHPLELTAAHLPLNQFGYFLNSMTQAFIPFPGGSQGNLCVGGSVGRFSKDVKGSGSAGEFSLDVDTLNIPQPMGDVAIQPGETWNFTCWFRDANPTSTSNFTDGISILFQ